MPGSLEPDIIRPSRDPQHGTHRHHAHPVHHRDPGRGPGRHRRILGPAGPDRPGGEAHRPRPAARGPDQHPRRNGRYQRPGRSRQETGRDRQRDLHQSLPGQRTGVRTGLRGDGKAAPASRELAPRQVHAAVRSPRRVVQHRRQHAAGRDLLHPALRGQRRAAVRAGARPQGNGAGGGRLSDVRVQHDARLHLRPGRQRVHAAPRDRGILALPREYPDAGQRKGLCRQRRQLSQMARRHAPVHRSSQGIGQGEGAAVLVAILGVPGRRRAPPPPRRGDLPVSRRDGQAGREAAPAV